MQAKTNHTLITDSDLATFTVCEEAWKLKRNHQHQHKKSNHSQESKIRKEQWKIDNELSKILSKCWRIILVALIMIIAAILLFEDKKMSLMRNQSNLSPMEQQLTENKIKQFFDGNNLIIIIIFFGCMIIVWNLIAKRRAETEKKTGIDKNLKHISIANSQRLPQEKLISTTLGIITSPDAIFVEDDLFIPVDRHPMSRKIQDRHVIKAIAHLKAIEETKGKSSPYALLIMGKNARNVKLNYSNEKLEKLEKTVCRIREVISGSTTVPTPEYYKCLNCDVKNICKFRIKNNS